MSKTITQIETEIGLYKEKRDRTIIEAERAISSARELYGRDLEILLKACAAPEPTIPEVPTPQEAP